MTGEERLILLSVIIEDIKQEGARMYGDFAQAAHARGDLDAAALWQSIADREWDPDRVLAVNRGRE